MLGRSGSLSFYLPCYHPWQSLAFMGKIMMIIKVRTKVGIHHTTLLPESNVANYDEYLYWTNEYNKDLTQVFRMNNSPQSSDLFTKNEEWRCLRRV
jgi:hypothetical protein